MKVTTIKLTASLLFIFAALATPAIACSYISVPDPPLEYVVSKTETIFIGTLIKKNFRYVTDGGDKYKIHSLLFRIDKGLKGKKGGTYLLQFGERVRKTSCDYAPPESSVGEKWTVFDGYEQRDGLSSNVMREEYLSSKFESDDAKYIEQISQAIEKPKTSFFGQIGGFFSPSKPPLSVVELRSRDGLRLLQTTKLVSNMGLLQNQFDFSFTDLQPGEYTIRIRSSQKFSFTPVERELLFEPEGNEFKLDYPITIRKNEPEFVHFIFR